jgi:hypothetical protein
MNPSLRFLTLFLFALPAVAPAQKPDLAGAEKALDAMFDRPQGTPISEEQKGRLAAFLKQHEGQDLAHLGYARALHLYLTGDSEGAVAAMDEFFARQPAIKHPEHRNMAGRIYLSAVVLEGRKDNPDLARLTTWGQHMTRLYDDVDMLGRQSKAILQRLKDPATFRVALAQGVFQSALPTASKDAFLKSLYGEAAAPASRPGSTPTSR